MANDSRRNLLRPEAGPVPFKKLQKRAKEALNRIIPALAESAYSAALAVPGDTGERQASSEIDTTRTSRLFFVSGEPGSGKSTVYLTLRAMTSAKENKDYGDGYEHQNQLNKLKGAVRWLEPLDLEVAGDERDNLLAAVLVRLFDALDRSAGVLSKPCEAAIKELEELATDIGIAWEGNLQARAGALDPSTYSEEVMLAQRARLGVNKRLRQALDNIAKNGCCGCNDGTLFVLPVEDLYLKPDASLQLLRLLRMISIPRLFFLVMGDINTIEALFIEKSLADWTAVAGTRLFASRSDRLDEALTRARELRARYLRKLLPPGQRTAIEAMDWHEAMNFELGRPKSNKDAVKTLENILIRVKLDRPPDKSKAENRSLLAFLVSPSFSYFTPEGEFKKEEFKKEKQKREQEAKKDVKKIESPDERDRKRKEERLKKHRSAYTALQILDATPREMMDLGFALREVIRQKREIEKEGVADEDIGQTPLLLLHVRDIVNLVREEQSILNEKQQKVLEGILPTRHYSPEDINFAMERLSLRPSPRTWKDQTPQTWKDQNSGQLWVRDHRSFDLTVNRRFITKTDENESMEQANNDPFATLPPRPAAWFVLLHDLAWEWNPDSVTGNLVERFCHEANEFRSTPTERAKKREPVPFLGWAVWSDKGTYRHFPMPEFKTFRDLDRFLFVWSSGLDWLSKVKKQAEAAQKLREGTQAEAANKQTGALIKQGKNAKNKAGEPKKAEEAQKLAEAATKTQQDANETQRLAEIRYIDLWALAGWTLLTDAYKKFSDTGDDWFKDFAETTGGNLKERFENFRKDLNDFEYPVHKDDEITMWLGNPDRWPKQ